MTDTSAHARMQRAVDAIRPGATLLRAWPLEGGVSALVTAVDLTHPDGTVERMVVRRHGAIDKGHNPEIATTEYRLLAAVHAAGLAVPKPLLLDQDCEFFDTPGLVTAFIDGSTEPAPGSLPEALRQMAVFLARLHALDIDRLNLPALPRRDDPIPGTLADLPGLPFEARVREALAGRSLHNPINAPALLHGDFWPGNIMWRDGDIAAVIDWEDAASGDPLADLAGSRIELLWKHGDEAMTTFTNLYMALSPVDLANLPLWELRAASGASARMHEWGLDPEIEAEMRRRAAWLVDRAIARLPAR
jgi:aminoglycoside phosphotransferase (APT) family kinase protein